MEGSKQKQLLMEREVLMSLGLRRWQDTSSAPTLLPRPLKLGCRSVLEEEGTLPEGVCPLPPNCKLFGLYLICHSALLSLSLLLLLLPSL